jgi:tetratricopeptide (TPR) repeat protein
MLAKIRFEQYACIVATLLFCSVLPAAAQQGAVRAWEEQLVVPTYPADAPERAPMFYEGRAYQGAKGAVYPYPFIDKLFDQKVDKSYKAVYLENEFVRICVVPELGGRIFEAIDKTDQYNFFYRQHVIKPALIGMLGAWISGGVEWNIPHHHRASSFMPVQYRIEEGADGSRTVWVGETELRHRMRWVRGLTLRPGKSYVEATLRLFNRSAMTHSFLYFANVAVHANENYQIVFPPSTEFAVQHAKVEFSRWPISTNTYGGVDRSKGVDVSWYKNHPTPASMFAFESKEDFLAGYDHGKEAGTLHIAEHGIMPGKKFFTWGVQGDGKAWDQLLTDTDGPYLELMVGGYSDNQPDYSWIQPYEVKTVKEFWYPYQKIGGVKNANIEGAVNLEVEAGKAKFGFHSTEAHASALVKVTAAGQNVFEKTISIDPGHPYQADAALPAGVEPHEVRASLSSNGRELVAYQPAAPKAASPMPTKVTPPPAPKDMKTVEELYLAGQRLEQFYSPSREPDPYYQEALRRDPDDSRVNTAMGLLELHRGLFTKAEQHFQTAIERLTKNYTRPRNGEPLYYLGIALKYEGQFDEATEAFNRAAWSVAWSTPANYALAELASRKGDRPQALVYLDRALATDAENTKAIVLRAALLRRGGRNEEAARLLEGVRRLDPLDVWARRENALLLGVKEPIDAGSSRNDDRQPYLEMAVDYANAGLRDEAISVLRDLAKAQSDPAQVDPLVYYHLADLETELGAKEQAAADYQLALKASPDYCFPFRLESIGVLKRAIESNPSDARAPYYLGNLLYDLQPEEAIAMWEKSRTLDPSYAMVHRNLGLAYENRKGDHAKSIVSLEEAFRLSDDPRFLNELDTESELAGVDARKRLDFLLKNEKAVVDRDDTLAREIELHVQLGDYDRALELLKSRVFHVWEGARFTAHDSYVNAQLLRAHGLLKADKADEALAGYKAALEYPENLSTGKPYRGDRSPEIDYFVGRALEAKHATSEAKEWYRKSAAEESRDPSVRFHQAKAMAALGDTKKAEAIFGELIRDGERQLARASKGGVEDFAKFGDRGSTVQREADAHYVLGLGQLGKGDKAKARAEFTESLKLNPNLFWAKYELSTLKL